jgi:wyosine [tRNA(Phe)-imidazoG37] synthetase (radical SAM superfamily)
MTNASKIIYGPVPSRRLGNSLGINNIFKKKCSYSCVYCQVGKTNFLQIDRREFYDPENIFIEIRNRIEQVRNSDGIIDYLCFVSNGEPTLDINLKKSINILKEFGIRIAVISNSSIIWKDDVQDALSEADYVSVKIDTLDENEWKVLNCPHPLLKMDRIIKGIESFRTNYKGILTTETMLLDGYNTGSDSLIQTATFIANLQPHKAFLSIPIRTPALKSAKIPPVNTLDYACKIFKLAYEESEFLNYYESNDFYFSENIENDFLKTIDVHPMRKDAVEKYLNDNNKNWDFIDNLLMNNKIKEYFHNGNTFYIKHI